MFRLSRSVNVAGCPVICSAGEFGGHIPAGPTEGPPLDVYRSPWEHEAFVGHQNP